MAPKTTSYSPQKDTAAINRSSYVPELMTAKPRVHPLVRIFEWRCSQEGCNYVNETLASKEGYVRMIPSGEEPQEPMWYGEKCEMCREKAGKGCLLLQTKPVTPFQPVGEVKDKAKAPEGEDVEMEG